MLLQWILEQLDGELNRLTELRAIVSELGTSPYALPALTEPALSVEIPARGPLADLKSFEPQPLLTAPAEQIVASAPEAKPRLRRAPRKKNDKPVPPTILLPRGPIVVSAAELQKERDQRGSRNTPPQDEGNSRPEVSPDSAARLLAARWLASERQEGNSPAA